MVQATVVVRGEGECVASIPWSQCCRRSKTVGARMEEGRREEGGRGRDEGGDCNEEGNNICRPLCTSVIDSPCGRRREAYALVTAYDEGAPMGCAYVCNSHAMRLPTVFETYESRSRLYREVSLWFHSEGTRQKGPHGPSKPTSSAPRVMSTTA